MTKQNIGLGCMGMSGMYGKGDDAQSVAVIQAAIERGVTLLDTGDFYGMGHNEMLIGKAIAGRRDKVQLSVKFGALRGPDGSWIGVDNRPAAAATFLAYSLKRLGTDHIDIYRPARLDPNVPIEDTIGALAELVKKGFVRQIGLSEVGVETIRRAHKIHPIVDLQIEYSPISRAPEAKIFGVLHELGIGATLYGVMSRGLLTGAKLQPAQDYRQFLPRFTGENYAKNASIAERFGALAKSWGMTPGQLALAYVQTKQPRFTPLAGARTLAQLEDALGAPRTLAPEQLATLEAQVNPDEIAGPRYQPAQMAHLDSEH